MIALRPSMTGSQHFDAKLTARIDSRIEALDAKLTARIDTLEALLTPKVDALTIAVSRLEGSGLSWPARAAPCSLRRPIAAGREGD